MIFSHFKTQFYAMTALVPLLATGCATHSGPMSTDGAKSPSGAATEISQNMLESGDIIFLDLDCGELCDAIEDVTLEQFKVTGPRLSHVGIVDRTPTGELRVLEAWPEGGVHEVELDAFLSRVKGGQNEADGYYIGHFKPQYRLKAREALTNAQSQMGKPYDSEFLTNNKKYYCSELVAEGFSNKATASTNSSALFHYRPMYFGKPGSTAYITWQKYYEKMGKKIPSGRPGISPLGIYIEGRAKYFL